MKRKPVRDLLKSIAALRSTIRSSHERLALRLAARPAAAGADYGPVFSDLEAELAAVESELATAETDYAVSPPLAYQCRQARDRVASEVGDQHAVIERFCRSQPKLKGAGIVDSTPSSPLALARQVSMTVDFLRRLERTPQTLSAGVSIDAGTLAEDLETGLPRLEAAIAAVYEADSQVAWTRERANRTFAEAGRVLSWVARAYEGLSGLAGEKALVGRVRRCCR